MRNVVLAVLLATTAAEANPRPLPMTYLTDTTAPGHGELELFGDLVPLRALSPTTTEEPRTSPVRSRSSSRSG